jgi:EAL domain-containing protein (putative c-di-GMP-specific phosphodiesterase class I)
MSPATGDSELALELQLAIERHELSLLYQPKVFIGLAERYGSIDALTEWVLRTGLAQWRSWSEQGLKTNIAFNISALSLRDIYFPDYLHRLCQTEGVPPANVTIEVTEGATQHLVRLLDTLTRFRLKGISVSLDDFGTGYSSLLQLRQLPYSELKIDRCFVRDAATSRESRLIIEAMIGLARGFGLTATAEGVEDEATLALLAELGCEQAQGYLIARPMEGWQLAPWLLDGGRRLQVVPIAAAAGKRRGG